ncbi:trypsin-like serine protease [Octadecabacter sp. 1_MG-2023]|uniref:trypsin-like serine peptidase n=1 Tax=unclassified Octadecabacter TaxID=196158 RepID=UPI001C0858CA|nr:MULTISPECIES: trypsin-like serine protease [unclassified Octadecabacter]MBU2994264.1 trypsin-like serine protease [Octadecabacter sp. B2R22]MDO6734447.1 trypsin-like serine protease [Octadecabacter sp. 1_MG-2023]
MLRYFIILVTFVIALPANAQDSCEFANDNECDEARYGGQGYCDDGTDTTDCRLVSQGIADDSCQWANDGECDEFRYGRGGACLDGSDTTDCLQWQGDRERNFMERALALELENDVIRSLGNNTCRWNNDDECDDGNLGGTGACTPGTDASDCIALVNGTAGAADGDNSCLYANDNECDEARFGGGGYCADGTDANDCSAGGANISETPTGGPGDTCEYANDNECDELRYGGGDYCAEGTDTTDCRQLAAGLDDDSCQWANDNECDELRYGGGGACVDGSDSTDCNNFGNSPEALARLLELVPDTLRAQLGDDSCEYANDAECDDVNFGGTVYCTPGTDASDCRAMALGGEDSCRWANDNECDEPGIGTNNCTSGTDVTDCADVAYLRNRTDTCSTAFDGICNEASGGDNTCEAFTDTADCLGRSRPAGLENHFFGRDDRFLVDATQMPWRAIGSIDGYCTGTLVGPSLVLTAAHCIFDEDNHLITPDFFYAGQSLGNNMGEAKVRSAYAFPGYTPDSAPAGGGNGDDWALLELASPLGDQVGYLNVHELTATELTQIGRSGLIVNQAGYSWDTGDNLSGNSGCRIVQAFNDSSVLHECDTAKGDSGSPFLLNLNGEWNVVALDSQFFDTEDEKSPFGQANLAVDSRAFAAEVAARQ